MYIRRPPEPCQSLLSAGFGGRFWRPESTMPKECPMCDASMRLVTKDHLDRVPGFTETHARQIREWTCPECDYFEEATEDDG
jgi:hypothetical protein